MAVNNIWVVIPAAGSGQRMQATLPKQYLPLNGQTIIEHTLDIFLNSQDVKSILVCLAEEDQIWSSLPCASHPKIHTTAGGSSRAISVLKGLNALSETANDQDWVLVHDAARPCLPSAILQSMIEQLKSDEVGGILAIPAKDTLKQSYTDKPSKIKKTLDRSLIWQAQTPQMFRYKLLKDALSQAIESNIDITDESSALEWAGYQPCLVEGDARNIKVTTPDDLVFAEFLLNQ